MIKLMNLKLPVRYDENALKKIVAETLGTPMKNIAEIKLLKESLDARKKNNPFYSVQAAVSLISGDDSFKNKFPVYEKTLSLIEELNLPKKSREAKIFVVGSGPAGLFAALTLCRMGFKPIVVERGDSAVKRAEKVALMREKGLLDTDSNIQFGEGGAGTFSDGKLNTGTSNQYIGIVLGEFIAHGAPETIGYSAKPHIGTDYLLDVVKNIRCDIEACGGEFRFRTELSDIETVSGEIKEAVFKNNNVIYRERCDALILCIGHSAENTFSMLRDRRFLLEPKPFSMGVRIEHRQSDIDAARYGSVKGLPPSDYKLSTRAKDGRGVYTFCMCPGGEVVAAASEECGVVTNGMSMYARNGANANSAVLVSVTPDDFGGDVLGGIAFQRRYERLAYNLGGGGYRAPAETVGSFVFGEKAYFDKVKPSYKPGVTIAPLKDCLPEFVTAGIKDALPYFGRSIRGFDDKTAVLTGIESRSSSPVRILRGENYESSIRGVYPAGEGAGYAGGITSSAVDGIRCALKAYEKL